MYKIIYINETPLVLIDGTLVKTFAPEIERKLIAKYSGKVKSLLNYVDMLEKSQRYEMVLLHTADVKQLFKDFKTLFKGIKAAGGLVFNQTGEALVIFRRQFWDLPKGKIDKGEKKKAAAVREVQEETGIKNVKLGALIAKTYHTYHDRKNIRILKLTYWYQMETTDTLLIPQTEEDIEIAKWMKIADCLALEAPIYKSVRDVMNLGMK